MCFYLISFDQIFFLSIYLSEGFKLGSDIYHLKGKWQLLKYDWVVIHIFQSMEIRLKIASNTNNAMMRCVDKFTKHNSGAVDTYCSFFLHVRGTIYMLLKWQCQYKLDLSKYVCWFKLKVKTLLEQTEHGMPCITKKTFVSLGLVRNLWRIAVRVPTEFLLSSLK